MLERRNPLNAGVNRKYTVQPPAVNKPYIITICYPNDFHDKFQHSRFKVLFSECSGNRWIFNLRHEKQDEKMRYNKIEAVSRNILEPIDPRKEENFVVCRFLNKNNDRHSDWVIALMNEDIASIPPEEKFNVMPEWFLRTLKKTA